MENKELNITNVEIKEDNHVKIVNTVDIKKDDNHTESTEECEMDKQDPYFYTKRNEFTSEIYKIEIGNIPSFVGYGQLKKLLASKLKLKPHKIKTINTFGHHPHFAFVTFKCEEDREKALSILHGYNFKGRNLHAKKANPMADPLVKKRKQGNAEDSLALKHPRIEGQDIPIAKRIKDAVHPLWNVPYEEQLKSKMEHLSQFLIRLGRSIEKANNCLQHWLQQQSKKNGGMCCTLLPIKGSPVHTAYRNKCEFTVGKHLYTGEKIVGFRLSSYKNGSMSVAEPDECINIPESMLKAVKSFQEYIQSSDKDVFNPETHEGYWRQLTVRTSRNNDVLLIVVIHPQKLSEEELQNEMKSLREYFENGPGKSCGVTSLYFHSLLKRKAKNDLDLQHLFGKKYIEETVLDMKFQINPESFFQINTAAAEVLYQTVIDLAQITSNTTVLDICCGTGTIGLCVAKSSFKVIGAEMCPRAIENAKSNALINKINNAEFICGKAEDVIQSIIQKVSTSDVVTILDPPRAGLNTKVLKFIRANEHLKRLVYVSCNQDGAMQNFIDLCRSPSNNYGGEPFVPTKAVIVDLFPHTNHYELVIIFERFSEAKMHLLSATEVKSDI